MNKDSTGYIHMEIK